MAKFELFYINLDTAPERRETLEASYAQAGFSDNWSLHRFPAFNKDSQEVRANAGKQTDAYKGNFISHYECVTREAKSDAHLMVCEDDCSFAPGCGDYIEKIVAMLPEDKWDVLLTEVTFLSGFELPVFIKLKGYSCNKNFHLINMANFPYAYAGSCSYVVNKASRYKFAEILLDQRNVTDFPFDICLRAALRYEQMVGYLIFPFVTSPSIHADLTQAPYHKLMGLSQDAHQLQLEILNTVRRMLSVHYDPAKAVNPTFLELAEIYDYTQEDKVLRNTVHWLQTLQAASYYNEFNGIQILDVGLPLPSSPSENA